MSDFETPFNKAGYIWSNPEGRKNTKLEGQKNNQKWPHGQNNLKKWMAEKLNIRSKIGLNNIRYSTVTVECIINYKLENNRT